MESNMENQQSEQQIQHALSAKAHLELIKERIKYLKMELKEATKEDKETNYELECYEKKWEMMKADFRRRRDDLETEYQNLKQEYKRHIKLSEEMLEKKLEERKSLLNYLHESNICERSQDDLKDFNWDSLKKLELKSVNKSSDLLSEQKKKATCLAHMNHKTQEQINKLYEAIHLTRSERERLVKKIDEMKEFKRQWQETMEYQEKRKAKMRNENESLNLLIKQCALTNEPLSEFLTKNVRAKCHSFLNSSSPEELLNGLMKFKARGSRMIKLLRHKEAKLGSDISRLQIATDQTVDQMQYYDNMVQMKNILNMNRNRGGNGGGGGGGGRGGDPILGGAEALGAPLYQGHGSNGGGYRGSSGDSD